MYVYTIHSPFIQNVQNALKSQTEYIWYMEKKISLQNNNNNNDDDNKNNNSAEYNDLYIIM